MNATQNEAVNRKRTAFELIGKTLFYAFAVFGLIFILILAGILSLISPGSKLAKIPEKAVLDIDFNTNYDEVRGDDFFAEFGNKSVYSVYDLVRAINLAAADDRIQALSANVNVTTLGMAQIQDIAEALNVFKSKGKKTYLFSNGMGSFGAGSKEYYLAAGFNEIWMQPNSDIGVTGVSIEVPFFKGILNKIGVEAEFYSRYEYKTAASSLMESNLLPPYKEELQKLGGGLFDQICGGIALKRNLTINQVKDAVNKAPLFAEEALDLGLVDRLGYRQELWANLREKYGAEQLDVSDYMNNIADYDDGKLPQIAFLALEGVIENGKSSNNPVNEAVAGSETIIKQLDEIGKKKNLKALILRVNSPGGSYTASNEIWYALKRFKTENNIPVVVSMGNYAASGGYFVSLAADYIFAEPATITGSIGVLGGKFVLEKLWKKLDVNWGQINYGKNAGILSVNHKFSVSEKAVFNQSLDRVYSDFVSKVAKARNISQSQMDKIARGRIWLGQDAARLGLVDELGGIETALAKAKALGGITEGTPFGLIYYPRRQSFQEKLTKFLENGGGLPSVSISQAIKESKFNTEDLQLILRMQHDAILPPFKIEM